MRVIVAGSRTIGGLLIVEYAMERFVASVISAQGHCAIDVVLSGGAPGVDRLGEEWAYRHGVKVEPHPALWQKYGQKAGPIRNGEMAASADALVAIWDGSSKGTADMIHRAYHAALTTYVLIATEHMRVVQPDAVEAERPA